MRFTNTLSFSANVTVNMAETVRSALSMLDVPEEKLNDFDHHSTIAIKIMDTQDVMITVANDRLWLWSNLENTDENWLMQNAQSVLRVLLNPMPFVETNQLTIGPGENGYQLKALIDTSCLDNPSNLAEIIRFFWLRLKEIFNQ
ncbi:InvB/SpaK family type III secretion system chaperone [Chromobacterium vaccinii]|uniref:InvB/SpaK family type III secretion system chaperone n=1 Tax=Chromobacterium vaccinii TaxID=1108595 RepID=UPI000E17B2DC|nr:hypothetical protein [Chromobacterium vaccinii]SUX30703.1 Invasion protein invB [Chromobacterium vaccinii]